MAKACMAKVAFFLAGTVALILGGLGVVLPLLPTTPFLLIAASCYVKSSSRLHSWLIQTRFYQTVAQDVLERKGMTCKMKRTILIPVLFLLFLMFITVDNWIIKALAVFLGVAKAVAFRYIPTIESGPVSEGARPRRRMS